MLREIDRTKLNDDVIVIIEEETLTDGSKVYNIVLVGALGRAMTTFNMADKAKASLLYLQLLSGIDIVGIDMDCLD